MLASAFKSTLSLSLLVLFAASAEANAALRESGVERNEAADTSNDASSSFSTTLLRADQRTLSTVTETKKHHERNSDDVLKNLSLGSRQLPSVGGGFTVGDEVAVRGGSMHESSHGDDDDDSSGKGGKGGGSYGKKGGGDDDSGGKGGKGGGSYGKKGGDDDDSSGKGGKGGKKGGDDDDDDDDNGPEITPEREDPPGPTSSCKLHPTDNPCLPGCGHGKILNPWKTEAQAIKDNDYQPASCIEYDCICADSACRMSWHDGCIAEYMVCQQTQICGAISSQPASISTYNFGACPNYNLVLAPTPECTAVAESPSSAPRPEGDDDDDDDGKGGKGGGSYGKKGGGDDDDGKGGKGGGSYGKKGGDDDDSSGKGGKGGGSYGKKGGDGDDDDSAGKGGM